MFSSPLIAAADAELDAERTRARLPAAANLRESVVGAALVGAFAAGVFALAGTSGRGDTSPAVVGALILLYAVACLVEFEVGTVYTDLSTTILVAILVLLPPSLVPIAVTAGFTASSALKVAGGRRHASKILPIAAQTSLPVLAPAAVLAALPPGAGWDGAAAVGLALIAYFAADLLVSIVYERLAYRHALRLPSAADAWVYLVDLMLAPVGFAIALAAADRPWAMVLVFAPLAALLRVFAAERRRRIDHALELSRAYRGTAMLLGDVVEADDAYTGSHSRDVVELALTVGRRMGLGSVGLRNLEFAALLHDVGKIAVPDEIINKPGPLTDEEWEVMKRHTIDGQRMLESVGGVLADVGVLVRASHEDYDGSGYPDGLAGEAIPLEARICSACDAFSAMTTDRSYRAAMPIADAIAELRRCAGRQFDPAVAAALIRVLEDEAAMRIETAAPAAARS